jgi:adenine-specific DNA-methyltransferase
MTWRVDIDKVGNFGNSLFINRNVNMKKQSTTNNIKIPDDNLGVLKKHFSHCFDKNGNFDFDKFKQEVSKIEDMDFSKESYNLDWLGKSYARLLGSDEATTLLKEDENWNKKKENQNSENLLIKGDNLEVLKHLSNAYHEKVKMVYIDPPYNTGSDGFVYEDDRKFSVGELSKLAGVTEEKAKRILDFTQSKSNSHSAWLTFMYPRLYIAKQLLKEDGVIFVSIDDNEVAQLRIMMDEIFGEENFVGTFLWKKTENIKMDSKYFSENKDYILCYKKGELEEFNKILSTKDRYNLEDEKGKYYLRKLDSKSSSYSKSLDYVIEYNGKKYYAGGSYEKWKKRQEGGNSKKDAIWLWSKNKFEEGLKNNEIVFKNGNVYNKVRYDGVAKKPYTDFMNASSGQSSQRYVDKLFGGIRIFDHPKPVDLIAEFLKMTQSEDKNDIILDFFAGSGTTADAVMQLNAEDGGNKKYILVQLPEKIDSKKNKTAYDFVKNELKLENPTIFDITKERLTRAGKKIQEDNEKSKEPKDLSSVDFGFKIFETTPIWEDYHLEAENFDPQAKLFDESKLSKEDLKTLLITWKTYDGFSLAQNLKEIDLGGYKGHYLDNKLYLVDKGFETKHLRKLLEEIDENKDFNPATIIVFGYNFQSKILREIADNVKNYANKKQIDIDFITRY